MPNVTDFYGVPPDSGAGNGSGIGAMRVLLIEDDASVRRIVRKMLERGRHEVTEAENGRVGLDRLRDSAFDLVITDIVMPEMDGLETLIELRKHYPDGDRDVGRWSRREYGLPGLSREARSIRSAAQTFHA